jgi:hypothetical protein
MTDNDRDTIAKFRAEHAEDLDELEKDFARFDRAVADAKEGFGHWDSCDPVVWAILALVRAQTNLALAIDHYANYADKGETQGVEQAIAARLEAVENLRKAIEEEPRGFQ